MNGIAPWAIENSVEARRADEGGTVDIDDCEKEA